MPRHRIEFHTEPPKTPRHRRGIFLALLSCFALYGAYLFAAESTGEQFPFLATATVMTQDAEEIGYDGALSLSARDSDDCIEKLDVLATQAANLYQHRTMTVRLSCVEKDTGLVMLYVKRAPARFHVCEASPGASPGASDATCAAGMLAVR